MQFAMPLLLAAALAASRLLAAEPAPYDPLKIPETKVQSQTYEVKDAKRERTVPIRVYLPASEKEKPAPVILFSHGLGGSRDNNPYLGNHWAKRGYAVVFVQHPGSDESVWKKESAPADRVAAMKKAASLENYVERGKDIPAVIDALAAWNGTAGHPLKGCLDLEHLGMSGHSFGAQTTQTLAGQSLARGRMSFGDARIDAAVMMSPSPPALGDPASAFATINIPCLLMTGTLDDSPIGNTTPEDRLKVFPHLARAAAWQVVFDKANHMAFGERPLKGESAADPRYHRAILALSTAFWDAELRENPEAKAWLSGPAARSVLVPADRWEMNAEAKLKP
jgi:predicted dienelactone hydrolase